MKIKIVEPGWGSFTGDFGTVKFTDGVSDDEVSSAEARHLSSLIAIENVDTGKSPSVAQVILDTHLAPMSVATVETAKPAEPFTPDRRYTGDELADLADKGGIKALRDIADPMGLTGRSIAELIGKILSVAGPLPDVPTDAVADASADTVGEKTEVSLQAQGEEATKGTGAPQGETQGDARSQEQPQA